MTAFAIVTIYDKKLPLMKALSQNCPRGKLSPSPNSNANPKPNPDPDWGAIFLGGNLPDTNNVNSNIKRKSPHLRYGYFN